MKTGDLSSAVGHRVAELRKDRGLSLSALAAAAGIGKGSLSELEAGDRNPTLATLYALAGQLEVPLASLLGDEIGTSLVAGGLTHHLIDVRRTETATRETYRVEGEADAERHSPAHGPGVTEHLLVTEGSIRAGTVGAEAQAGPGQTLTWVSDREHFYQVVEAPFAAVLVIVTPVS
ncbi:MAG: transcriptional regulator [Actinobacteria bacterium HGW-Actinobacteria-2]|nr:MAG: transcriptional regulator [Actinobacteria bacterium HGW-Actinobacteria-2]